MNLPPLNLAASGRVRVSVVDAATGETVREFPWQSNLILDSGLDRLATERWKDQLLYAVAGTGNTPTKDLPDGTCSQSGTTVTRDTGTRDFISGDVGKVLRFATGEERRITAFIGATSVTVDTAGTVASAAITLYRVAQTGLAAEVKRTNTYAVYTDTDGVTLSADNILDNVTAKILYRRTFDFSAESGSVNYTEVGFSSQSGSGNNLFSRVLLAGAVTVLSGQQLRVRYELSVKMANALAAEQITAAMTVTGWPIAYNISSITSTGANFTVTFSTPHHFAAGSKVNISGAKRTRVAITAAASNSTTFTFTAPSHGRSPGDVIIVEGVSPSGYNGEWTVATTPDGNTLTVTNAANPGTGTVFGNLRQKEPGTWYDGEWTVASVTSTTIVVTSAINPPSAGADGTGYGNTKAKQYVAHYLLVAFQSADTGFHSGVPGYADGAGQNRCLFEPSARNDLNSVTTFYAFVQSTALSAPTWPTNGDWNPSGTRTNGDGLKALTQGAYTNGTFYRDYTVTFTASQANFNDIRTMGISANSAGNRVMVIWSFEERQKKASDYALTLTFRVSWSRDLSGGAS